jgi:hypothetical protein
MIESRISGNLNIISSTRPILAPQRFDVDLHGRSICNECGEDHGFKPTFDDVKTSIEVIPELLEKIKAWEAFN